jgi:hypothetical protein
MHAPQPAEMTTELKRAAAERSVVVALEGCIASVAHLPPNAADDPLLHVSPDTVDALRGCVAEYAHTLRAIDDPPERVLVALKGMLNDVVPASLNPDAFKSAAITWCIEAYYDAG